MLEKLVEVVRSRASGDPGTLSEAIASLISTAPAAVRELATLLGTRSVRVRLGWRSIESRYLGPLADTWRQVADDTGATDPREADLANAVQIGASAGGEVYFGLCWNERGVQVAEIDFEEGFITWFDTVEAFFEAVASSERERGEALPEALVAILPSAVPPAAAAPPPPAVQLYGGTAPPHPFAAAQAHFGQPQQVFAAGPTPRGRTVLVRRFAAGSPYTPCAIVVREPDGTVRDLPWLDTKDIYGLCLVPGHERALVCAGTPGPILELDLETGTTVERVAKARWSCGFVDDQHFVAHEDGEARVHAYAGGGAPVAATPIAGFNLFVGHGRVFIVPDGALSSLAWNGSTLVPELAPTPLPTRVNFFSAAVVHDGRRLLCSVDIKGSATWFDYGPA